MRHTPILLNEALTFIPKGARLVIDCTIGDGGHAQKILETNPQVRLLGLDADSDAITHAQKALSRFGQRVKIVQANFAQVDLIAQQEHWSRVDFLLADIGFSSTQTEAGLKGFSFRRLTEPLDMRFDPSHGESAAVFLNMASEEEIGAVLRRFGELKEWRKIAAAIVHARSKKPFAIVSDLIVVIEKIIKRSSRLHPATLVFQALRIYVNKELENLTALLEASLRIMNTNGRIAIISFHSLEDKIVKNFFTSNREHLKVLTKEPITPARQEIIANPKARSAKLRVAEYGRLSENVIARER
jgi:16S rRNA (cytosine1402-N4)-methyltransferase